MALTKLTQNLIDGTLVTSVNSLTGAVTLETGTDWVNTIQTSNFTAVAGKGYFVNTTSGEITVTLPAGTVGNEVIIQDYAGTFNTNKVTISADGSEKIQGSGSDFQCTTNNARVSLVYQDSTKGWTATDITALPLIIEYLVVAGGGAGGGNSWISGGGGAGGLRTSYGSTSGGGASAETDITASPGDSFTVTIGAGGAGTQSGQGGSGSNSVFSTITSTGGGGGGASFNSSAANGLSGGSGGGAGGATYYSGSGGSGTANQGYGGGSSSAVPGCGVGSCQAGGGGGAAGSGSSNVTSTDNTTSGGAGLILDITGSNVTYGYGGRGLQLNSTYTAGGGTTNTGNGGWGGWHDPSAGSNPKDVSGASGIVILKYPAGNSLTIGAGLTGSTATVGSSKVTSFTAGTGTITFA